METNDISALSMLVNFLKKREALVNAGVTLPETGAYNVLMNDGSHRIVDQKTAKQFVVNGTAYCFQQTDYGCSYFAKQVDELAEFVEKEYDKQFGTLI